MRAYSSLRVERRIVLGFLLVILAGTLLLYMGNRGFAPLTMLDALFMATSAVCVTGLAVVDPGTALSPFGQGVLLALIQIGGIGVMAAMTTLSLLAGSRIGIGQRLLLSGGFGIDTPAGAVRLLKDVVRATLFIEGVGALLLYAVFAQEFAPGRAAWLAVFHSVSAFCNAGFSLFSTNLEGYATNAPVTFTIMALIILGGLGFPVLMNLRTKLREEGNLSLHAKTVLFSTACLLFGGWVILLVAEWNGAFAGLSTPWKVWNALFASVTPRTAGFDTISYAAFTPAGLACTMFLMFVGASPASTGGGIKTTTLALLFLAARRDVLGENDVTAWRRRIPWPTIGRALTLTILYTTTLLGAMLLLNLTEKLPFTKLVFEAVSAMGTVGLSTGITSQLSAFGKVVIILLMFWGRVGIVTFLYGIANREVRGHLSYADGEISVG